MKQGGGAPAATKSIPYSSITLVLPVDAMRFALETSTGRYTFLCESTAARAQWIRNIAMLAGCSAQVRHAVDEVKARADVSTSGHARATDGWEWEIQRKGDKVPR